MDDPLSRGLREDAGGILNDNENGQSSSFDAIDSNINEKSSSLSISHSHNDWILPSTNERKEEVEINREQTKIYVCDPKKHKSNLDSFVTYLITTQTFNDSVKIKETNVRRRYNDFIWLKNLLDIKYPFNIISPLPAKHTLSKKFHVVADDGEFIRRRMTGNKEKIKNIFLYFFLFFVFKVYKIFFNVLSIIRLYPLIHLYNYLYQLMMIHYILLYNNHYHHHHQLLKLVHQIQIHFVNLLVVVNQYQVNFLVQKIKFKHYKIIYVNLNV